MRKLADRFGSELREVVESVGTASEQAATLRRKVEAFVEEVRAAQGRAGPDRAGYSARPLA